jgi:hypothetical protein
MSRYVRICVALALVSAFSLTIPASAAPGTPKWVLHVQRFPGGISNGVRAYLDQDLMAAQRGGGGSAAFAAQASSAVRAVAEADPITNIQINTVDSSPPLPQNETSVAFNPADSDFVVAAANDYINAGLWIGHSSDGGQTWSSWFQTPQVGLTRDPCTGSDPSVVYSARDQAFYVSTLCFSRAHPESEIHIWRSTNNGATWTPSRLSGVAVSNLSVNSAGSIVVDNSVFYDKELLAVDNNPSSASYGRLYMTYVKFHLQGSGFSDFCPVQVAFTDDTDPNHDGSLRDAVWTRTSVVPDRPGARGLGESANQWATPVVDDQGGLDIAYAIEDCNTAIDRGLRFRRSTDGGVSFSAAVRIDKAGQFQDNPDPGDLLPDKTPRLPISLSLTFDRVHHALVFAYQNNVNRAVSGADISIQRSDDYGATWSDAQFVSVADGAPAPNDQFFPAIGTDPSGVIHAIWFDNRNDTGNRLIETFHADSADGGVTWTANDDISTAAWDPNSAFFSSGSFIGDYNWIAPASTDREYPVWTDGRNSPGPPFGQTDLFTGFGF